MVKAIRNGSIVKYEGMSLEEGISTLLETLDIVLNGLEKAMKFVESSEQYSYYLGAHTAHLIHKAQLMGLLGDDTLMKEIEERARLAKFENLKGGNA